jgi:hypothetical protein
MRTDASVANSDTALAALMRETAAATVDTVLAELRRRPIVHPECALPSYYIRTELIFLSPRI